MLRKSDNRGRTAKVSLLYFFLTGVSILAVLSVATLLPFAQFAVFASDWPVFSDQQLAYPAALSYLADDLKVSQTLSFCDAPTMLPKTTPLATYSPALCFAYNGLEQGMYTIKAYLLETDPPGDFLCASGQWCGDVSTPQALFTIDNTTGSNATGRIETVRDMDVHSYNNFLWVIDLYKDGVKIVPATATQGASSTTNRAPILKLIGGKTGAACQPLAFTLAATDPEGDAVSFTAQNLPSGATFDGATGKFDWTCPVAGTYASVIFEAIQAGASSLSDAEMIAIQINSTSLSSHVYLPFVVQRQVLLTFHHFFR